MQRLQVVAGGSSRKAIPAQNRLHLPEIHPVGAGVGNILDRAGEIHFVRNAAPKGPENPFLQHLVGLRADAQNHGNDSGDVIGLARLKQIPIQEPDHVLGGFDPRNLASHIIRKFLIVLDEIEDPVVGLSQIGGAPLRRIELRLEHSRPGGVFL